MQNINSDQLRKRLAKHTRKMNWLAEQYDLIVELLAQRGLKAIEPDNNDVAIHPCVMQLDKLGEALFRTQFEPKRREEMPLTSDELKAGGWLCADISEECRLVFAEKGLDTRSAKWSSEDEYKYCYLSGTVIVRSPMWHYASSLKQIRRIGNNFYWGAASDQAN